MPEGVIENTNIPEVPDEIRNVCIAYYEDELMPLYENKGATLAPEDIIESWNNFKKKPDGRGVPRSEFRIMTTLHDLWLVSGQLITDTSFNADKRHDERMLAIIARHRGYVCQIIEEAMVAAEGPPPGYIVMPKKYNPILDPAPPAMFRVKRIRH